MLGRCAQAAMKRHQKLHVRIMIDHYPHTEKRPHGLPSMDLNIRKITLSAK